jgi:hypothetical protein
VTYEAGSSAIFAIETASAAPSAAGTDYDRINVTSQTAGALTIETGTTLELNFTADSLAFLQNQGEGYTSANYFLFTLGSGTSAGEFSTLTINQGGNTYTGSIIDGVATFSELNLEFDVGYTGNSATNSLTGGRDLSLTATVIPEPGAVALLMLGGMGFIATGRKRGI